MKVTWLVAGWLYTRLFGNTYRFYSPLFWAHVPVICLLISQIFIPHMRTCFVNCQHHLLLEWKCFLNPCNPCHLPVQNGIVQAFLSIRITSLQALLTSNISICCTAYPPKWNLNDSPDVSDHLNTEYDYFGKTIPSPSLHFKSWWHNISVLHSYRNPCFVKLRYSNRNFLIFFSIVSFSNQY